MHMRLLSLLLLFLAVPNNYSQPATPVQAIRTDRVMVKPHTIVIVRSGKLARDFPEKRRATIKFPVISGLGDARVLQKVQSILQIKNVFDTSVAEYREDNWLEEFAYKVNYNKDHILDITFSQSGSGAYPDSQTKHFAINLRNGSVIKTSDAFVANKLDSLAGLVKARFQAELAHILKDLAESRSDPEDIRIAREAQDALEFKLSDIDDFSISDKGVAFLYHAGYPHASKAFDPEGRNFFSYRELKPYIKRDGPLGQF